MSVLDPISRQNTGDNTPAMVHYRMTEGEELKISFLAKGFGSENMSRLYMLKPSDGEEGIKGAAVETVRLAGGKPCPPVIVGIGVGGTADKAMELSKRALLRKIGSKNPDPGLYALEEEILQRINALKIGAQGFGGDTTALAVFIEKFPTHIAALPVGVNIQCHSVRKGEVAL
jgi:fumarate hydratase subunit alpha